jgi:hypothetical protein
MTDKDQCRAAFEKNQAKMFAADEACWYKRDKNGYYVISQMETHWQLWQAAWVHQSAALATKDAEIARLKDALHCALPSFSPRVCHYGFYTGHDGTIRADKLQELWQVYNSVQSQGVG